MHVLSSKIWYFNFRHVFVFFLRRFVVFFFCFTVFPEPFHWILLLNFHSANWFYIAWHVAKAEAETRDEGWEWEQQGWASNNTLWVSVREWVSGLGLFMFICLALMCAFRQKERGLLFNSISLWFLRFPAFALRLCAVLTSYKSPAQYAKSLL